MFSTTLNVSLEKSKSFVLESILFPLSCCLPIILWHQEQSQALGYNHTTAQHTASSQSRNLAGAGAVAVAHSCLRAGSCPHPSWDISSCKHHICVWPSLWSRAKAERCKRYTDHRHAVMGLSQCSAGSSPWFPSAAKGSSAHMNTCLRDPNGWRLWLH